MKNLLLMALLLGMLLAGCQRPGQASETPSPNFGEAVPPSPTLPPVNTGGGFDLPVLGSDDEPAPEGEVPVAGAEPALAERFRNLRFATSGEGSAQSTFPVGTEEVYAVWDYDGMNASDSMTRIWYLNDAVEVERTEAWDFLKYGFSGTVRDVFYYDYIDGVDPGTWRVELYLNNELQTSGTFTVGP